MNIPFKCPTFVSVSLILCLKLQRDWRMWQEEHCIVPLCYGLPATLLSLENIQVFQIRQVWKLETILVQL